MHTLDYTLTRDDDDIDITVEYSVARFVPARTYGRPEDCYPSYGGEVEAISATTIEGDHISLTVEEFRKVERWIYDHHDYEDDGEL